MEVVLRPAGDRFLTKVVFPALEAGVVDAGAGFAHLLSFVGDEGLRSQLELLQEQHDGSTFFGLTDERWTGCIYALLFSEWLEERGRWQPTSAFDAYAGGWEDAFHLALMLEDPSYPYADEDEAERYRRAVWAQPSAKHGLASLLVGAWEPFPSFPPDQVLTVEGAGVYDRTAQVARADWAWRSRHQVAEWAARLPSALSRLIAREEKRLSPVEAPERHEVLEYWLGRTDAAPLLAVLFSGLGPRAVDWIVDLGRMARLVRRAAAAQQGLTVVLSRAEGPGGR